MFATDHDLHLAAWQVGVHEDGRPRMVGHFNGRIDNPRLASKVVVCHEMTKLARTIPPRAPWVLAAWDFGRDIPTDGFPDVSGNNLHGRLVNLPTRGVTGYRWDGSCHDWTQKPEHYAAIHFHADDLHDAGWETSVTLKVPDGLKSGLYAGRFHAGDDEAYVPFYVRPAVGARKAKIAFLGSTATYMAYSNNHWQIDEEKAEVKRGRIIAYTGDELFLNERRDLGLSTYDTHADGSGVVYSSRLRPIVLNFNPKSIVWSFNADTHVTDWLEARGFDFDVVTDEDIQDEGVAALEDYNVVVTGTHPEYWSTEMWDALVAYFDRGGRMMYLGGNGFYWRIAWNPDRTAIEIRRAESGARFWVSRPGEYHQSFNGELGGLWKRIGRPPQSLVGIGTFATGFDRCGCFERKEGSRHPRAAWIFEGVSEERIGDFGVLGNGAAGIELDGMDVELGSPPDTIVLASSTGHSAYYLQSPDEIVFNHAAVSGDANPRVRADMIYYTLPSGAGVFATGSISW
ncbi:MAG: N,N-dimethylformamidase, partial [Alphaproteobacteria bacterium]|nr:N,N-dimethylformamidase [Alphaproteobacteria bacterium]